MLLAFADGTIGKFLTKIRHLRLFDFHYMELLNPKHSKDLTFV